MAEERNVKWILIVSLIMLGVTLYSGTLASALYYPSRVWTIFDHFVYWASRIGTLSFIATIATATLSATGFRKDLLYKVSIYLFAASMTLLFVNVLAWVFRF